MLHENQIRDFIGNYVWYDHERIWGGTPSDARLLADIRGWGAIQNLFKAKDGSVDFDKAIEFQDALGAWMADAIQQKLTTTETKDNE